MTVEVELLTKLANVQIIFVSLHLEYMKPSLHLIWICLLLLTACAQHPVFKKNTTLYRIGDVPEWSEMKFDDKSWQQRPRWVPDGQIFLVKNSN